VGAARVPQFENQVMLTRVQPGILHLNTLA